jgi:hypothetical protein
MMIYNRRKRAEFFAEQKAKHEIAIYDAKVAMEYGNATEAQLEFMKRENAEQARVDALRREKKQKPGMFKRASAWLFSGLKEEEEGDDVGSSEARLGYEALSEEDDTLGERESDIVRAIEEKKMAFKERAKQVFADEKERQDTGGPLDRLRSSDHPSHSREDPQKSEGGWTSFMTRR